MRKPIKNWMVYLTSIMLFFFAALIAQIAEWLGGFFGPVGHIVGVMIGVLLEVPLAFVGVLWIIEPDRFISKIEQDKP